MAVQRGIDMLLKIGSASNNPITVAGLRTTTFTVGNEGVDITNKDSGGYKTLLEGAGMKSMSFSADGVLDDGASQDILRGFALNDSINVFSLFFGNGDIIEGNFQITSYERTGAFNTEETFSITLESSGSYVYTQA